MRNCLLAGLFMLAACGQPQSSTQTPAPPSATAPAQTQASADDDAAEQQARVAALPAPYNEASYADGRRAFAQCRSCHTIEAGAGNRVGPNLHGVVGRAAASAAGFSYSQALQDAGFTWDAAHLEQWLANPQAMLPGNRMAFAGVRDETQRRDLIAYLIVASTEDAD